MKIKFYSQTDIGKKRQLNEDCFGVSEEENLYFVCDGMGGHAGGNIASKLAVATIIDYLKNVNQPDFSPPAISDFPWNDRKKTKHLVTAIATANRRLFNLALEYPQLRGMGTTFAGLTIEDDCVTIVHVGDSRVYLWRKGKLALLTEDHSWLNELLQDKEISSEEAKNFKQKNVITRALGTNPLVKIDLKLEKLRERDIFVICTDGLTGKVTNEEIGKIVGDKKGNLESATNTLIQLANERGGPDNITAILLEIEKIEESSKICEETNALGKVYTIPGGNDSFGEEIDRQLKKTYAKETLSFVIPPLPQKIWQRPVFFLVLAGVLILPVLGYILRANNSNQTVATSAANEGKIKIDTIPSGANVYLDKEIQPRGQTPLEIALLLQDVKSENIHTLKLAKEGYLPKEISCEVLPRNETTVTEILSPESKLELILDIDANFSEKASIYLKKIGGKDNFLTDIAKLQNISYVSDIAQGDFTLLVKDNNKVAWLLRFATRLNEKTKIYVGRKDKKTVLVYENF